MAHPSLARADLIAQLQNHTPLEGFNETAIAGLRLYRQVRPTAEPMPVVYEPSVCVIAQGTKRLLFGERSILYDPWHFLVNPLTLPVHVEVPEASEERPFLGFLIRFDPVQVGKLLAEMEGMIDWPKGTAPQTVTAWPLDETLAHAMVRLVGCLDDALDRRVLAGGLVREILYAVLRGPKGHILRQQALEGSKGRQVARAVAFMEANYRHSLDVETIARQAAMSPSALHQQFKRLTALSPMQFVQRLRLHKARALLLSGRGAAEAGFEVGYKSPSQFSREFRRLFGVPPSRVRSQELPWTGASQPPPSETSPAGT